jgi:MarR family transcriptional regulator for hemolysin
MPDTTRVGVTRDSGPPPEPLGMLIARVGKRLDRAFDDALSQVGGSRPTWLILLAIKTGAQPSQTAIAQRVGISGPTLIHHLDRLEDDGLIRRRPSRSNRRVHEVTLTKSGEQAFMRLREAAVGFDRRMHGGLTDRQTTQLRRLLTSVDANVGPAAAPRTAATDIGAPTQ